MKFEAILNETFIFGFKDETTINCFSKKLSGLAKNLFTRPKSMSWWACKKGLNESFVHGFINKNSNSEIISTSKVRIKVLFRLWSRCGDRNFQKVVNWPFIYYLSPHSFGHWFFCVLKLFEMQFYFIYNYDAFEWKVVNFDNTWLVSSSKKSIRYSFDFLRSEVFLIPRHRNTQLCYTLCNKFWMPKWN